MEPTRAISSAASFLVHAWAVIVLLTSPESAVWGGSCDGCGGIGSPRRQTPHPLVDGRAALLIVDFLAPCPDPRPVDREPVLLGHPEVRFAPGIFPVSGAADVPRPVLVCLHVEADGSVGPLRVLTQSGEHLARPLMLHDLAELRFRPAVAHGGPVPFWVRMVIVPHAPPPTPWPVQQPFSGPA